jgi:hypothetical protein
MFDGKKITSYTLGSEASGKAEYPNNEEASYIKYTCAFCLEPFFLVDPYSHDAGGCIQREFIKHKDTGEILGVRRTMVTCLRCVHDMMSRQQSRRS